MTDEAQFHLQELKAHLDTAETAGLQALSKAKQTEEMGLENLWSAVEHVLTVHIAGLGIEPSQLNKPAQRVTLDEAVARLAKITAVIQPKTLPQAAKELTTLLADLNCTLEEINQSDTEDSIDAIPRIVCNARKLSACPDCGAKLDAGDRTFLGTHCENCGSHWVE